MSTDNNAKGDDMTATETNGVVRLKKDGTPRAKRGESTSPEIPVQVDRGTHKTIFDMAKLVDESPRYVIAAGVEYLKTLDGGQLFDAVNAAKKATVTQRANA